ncbi:MBL fold metallo-hydrolase [Halalkalibacter akibai]|uniref:Late competence protein n=1 Tax=Halalkalibacter akibai (strain ATCC 43226 / DSM 21942 / CIP 109018 / JCM 9157 / 1139) TaxID=1236973 RepID=W4QX36_HALA3|nr:MBL fold metallo-hydrolase [Halalkalibacter akibai]GAE36661.1 late competence protein [Halalkalibacter akibai JCM 9157]
MKKAETIQDTNLDDVVETDQQNNEQVNVDETDKGSDEKEVLKGEENTKENPRDGPLEGLKVHFIDVGQADATLFEFSHDGEDFRILFDAGNWNRNDVLNYLNTHRISHIDILIGSHPHADHIGQMDQILNEIDVTEVWMSGDTTTSQAFQRVLDAIESSGVSYHEPRAGEIFDVGPLEIQILNPDRLTGDVHEGSIAAKFTYGETSFILTGDAETQTERAMLSRGFDLEADVLQLGHHGSSTSTIPEFLAAVNPAIAIVSAGENNQYGHPHDEVINRVIEAGIDVYGTYVHGTIIIKSDGQSLTVLTKEDGTLSPSSSGSSPPSSTSTNSTSESIAGSSSSLEKTTSNANCVDINSASDSELQEITHIGPARAEELIQLRPFNSLDDMSRISGIAAGRLADIKEEGLACVR